VTAKAVDNAEAVFYAEDVELDNSARNKRLMVYCAVIGVMVAIIAVSLGVFLERGDSSEGEDGDPRCMLDPGLFSVVVNCKCRNTTELYTETLSPEEIYFYHDTSAQLKTHLPPDTDTGGGISSCSPHNQAVLEIASFKRKGFTVSDIAEAKAQAFFDGALQLYGIILFYVQMDGDTWENKDNWLENYNFCQWFGVICSSRARIFALSLRSNGLAGTLPNDLYLLSNLFELDLSHNKGVYGTLPAKFMAKSDKLRK
jgi:hypothetical protein